MKEMIPTNAIPIDFLILPAEERVRNYSTAMVKSLMRNNGSSAVAATFTQEEFLCEHECGDSASPDIHCDPENIPPGKMNTAEV